MKKQAANPNRPVLMARSDLKGVLGGAGATTSEDPTPIRNPPKDPTKPN